MVFKSNPKEHATMTVRRCTAILSILAMISIAPPAGAAETIVDGFESTNIDTHLWSLIHMPEKRHWSDKQQKRSGKRSLAIRVKGYDIDKRCNCQVSEIREANAVRLKFGDEAWYSFSFKLNGHGSNSTNNRWQIAGWKQETDGSPFVSQRLDNGVFHITLESDKSRVLIATAEGEADGFISAMAKGLMSQFGFLTERAKYDGNDDVTLTYGDNPILPNPHKGWVDMVYHIKGDLNGGGFVEVYANGRFIVRATGTIGVRQSGGPSQYFRFGHNRAAMPGTATLFLDNYRRADTRIADQQ
jgi:hypothetical protein